MFEHILFIAQSSSLFYCLDIFAILLKRWKETSNTKLAYWHQVLATILIICVLFNSDSTYTIKLLIPRTFIMSCKDKSYLQLRCLFFNPKVLLFFLHENIWCAEALLMSTYNICVHGEKKCIFIWYFVLSVACIILGFQVSCLFFWYNELFVILVYSIWICDKVCRRELARKLYCTTTTSDPHSLWRASCLFSYCCYTAIRCYQNKICCTRGTKGNLLSFCLVESGYSLRKDFSSFEAWSFFKPNLDWIHPFLTIFWKSWISVLGIWG